MVGNYYIPQSSTTDFWGSPDIGDRTEYVLTKTKVVLKYFHPFSSYTISNVSCLMITSLIVKEE